RIEPSFSRFNMSVPILLFKATIEEIFFRVLLLTALVQASRSSNHALIISSMINISLNVLIMCLFFKHRTKKLL
ncbi:MAG: CPBP family intramembrane metalloprotease, partial [Actinobacteria bacterium]|nr:CPBP family intramembrane metalloprotease [Actinomycetota bacterium]